MRPDRSFVTAFARDLVDLDLGELDEGLRARTAAWAVDRMYGAGEVARSGFVLIGGMLALVIWARAGRPYWRLGHERRQSLAHSLARTRMPVVADYVKAIRSLAVTYAFEQ